MLKRTLEPEVMDTASEAIDYDSMDHGQVNRLFVDDLLAADPRIGSSSRSLQVFDAGTGTALIPLELMSRQALLNVTASDFAEQMLNIGRKNVQAAGLADSIRLVHSDCKNLPDADSSYDIVMSNSIIHHIPEPIRVLRELWRILKPDGFLFVRDLMRPDDETRLEWIVTTYAGTANPHQQQMFRESLHAALTVAEVRDLLELAGIPVNSVTATSDRHWTIAAARPVAT